MNFLPWTGPPSRLWTGAEYGKDGVARAWYCSDIRHGMDIKRVYETVDRDQTHTGSEPETE